MTYEEPYHEYRLDGSDENGWTLYRNGWGIGYTFRSRKRAEQAQTALNNAMALDFAAVRQDSPEPPCGDARPDPRTHPEYWTE